MPQKHENQRKHEEKTYTTGRRDTASVGLPDEITDIRDE